MLKNQIKYWAAVVVGLAAAVNSPAQSTVDITINPFGLTQSTLSWTISGDIASANGAIVPPGYIGYIYIPAEFTNAITSLPSGKVTIPLAGFGSLTNLTSGDSQPLQNLQFSLNGNVGEVKLLVGAYTSSNQPYTILPTSAGDALAITPASASEVINLAYADFNPGTYQYVYPGGPVAGPGVAFTTSLTFNLTIGEPVPEPGTLALAGVGLAGLVASRRRQVK